MTKLGESSESWDSLFTINPILIQDSVPNAMIRQSNMYFSSSDGDYTDRYAYEKDFHLLKKGTIPVKGGWRLYSSGPGIYLRQLISNILGIRFFGNNLILDPVLPAQLNGLEFTFDCFSLTKTFCFLIEGNKSITLECNGRVLTHIPNTNPYRSGGIIISKEELNSCDATILLHM